MAKKTSITQKYRRLLHSETMAGLVLILAAGLALLWANFPLLTIRQAYTEFSHLTLGPSELHLNLSLAHWAADGLLAIFFFVVGLELKQEFTTGSLRDIRKALVPVLAAVFGMLGPIAVYIGIQALSNSTNLDGWAVPVATDIAFALAVLGLFGKGLPPAARTFLMTLAVVDDLLGIILIAVFFAKDLNFSMLGIAILLIIIFGILSQKRIIKWYLLWPLGILAWYFMHLSGIHATIAGVALGMTVPALQRKAEKQALTAHLSDKLHFYSAGLVLPIFAFFAAGVNIVDAGGFSSMFTDPVAIGIYLGLPLGKLLGITGGVLLLISVFRLRLGANLTIMDVLPISLIAGIGFTVSLLIATLSFDPSTEISAHARVAVILGTLISAILGAVSTKWRTKYRHRYSDRTELHRSSP